MNAEIIICLVSVSVLPTPGGRKVSLKAVRTLCIIMNLKLRLEDTDSCPLAL